ncbi:MAG: inorganic phosphate transporter [Desulfomonile sp.]|nr:inorganic phosphate transporter [Desulfomonile sp.]
MPTDTILLAISVIAGAYMAWNIGANDVANSMASAVGARALTMRQALFVGSVVTFLGATFVGSHVAQTIRKGIIYASVIGDPRVLLLGLLAALLAASFWVFIATYKNLPVSTTHSIVGAMMGIGLIVAGPSAVNWKQMAFIVSSWVLSPVLSGLAAFLLFRFLERKVLSRMDTVEGAVNAAPLVIAATMFVMTISLFLDTPLGKKIGLGGVAGVVVAAVLAGCCYVACRLMLRHFFVGGKGSVADNIFRPLQVLTSCYVAFGNGANDVANAMGPLAGIYYILTTGSVAEAAPVPTFMLALGGGMICLGIVSWGHRVMETVGSKITQLTNVRGFTVDFSAATMVLVASMLGLPVSTTHAAVGAYLGIGLARGVEALDLAVVRRIVVYWIITVPAAALTAAIFYLALSLFFSGR